MNILLRTCRISSLVNWFSFGGIWQLLPVNAGECWWKNTVAGCINVMLIMIMLTIFVGQRFQSCYWLWNVWSECVDSTVWATSGRVLVHVHILCLQAFLSRPAPPNFFMSSHVMHSPQSSFWHPSHSPHLLLCLFLVLCTVWVLINHM